METRKAKLLAAIRKSGTGGTTFRATLPSKWVRTMGLSEEVRNLKLTFDEIGKKIIVEKD
ncbi:hypothetical protein [Paratissierella segnis]|uniref:AbrB/MazE/SpoVT family DNA-binding domain-containing protein n=1 Tax=Paratissierella segnis TaxID=2763679 RepID=A0A926EX74_9FIRM|nr:hypothetical protein [Paratissierella segnis]MBC8588079.1 AbrB/MazE/SpoVT family DNA-binding domain-containing protein [Paratissierella segnis]